MTVQCVRSHRDSQPDVRTVFVTFYPALVSFALRITGNHADAEDAVQDSLAALLTAEKRGIPCRKSYVYGTLRRKAIDQLRRQTRELPLFVDMAAPRTEVEAGSQRGVDLRAFVGLAGGDGRLPAIWRCIADGHTYREIALEIGTTPNAVKSLVWRARQRLNGASS